MKFGEAWKILSSLFATGNLHFQLHGNNLNHKSVSEKFLYYSLMKATCDALVISI